MSGRADDQNPARSRLAPHGSGRAVAWDGERRVAGGFDSGRRHAGPHGLPMATGNDQGRLGPVPVGQECLGAGDRGVCLGISRERLGTRGVGAGVCSRADDHAPVPADAAVLHASGGSADPRRSGQQDVGPRNPGGDLGAAQGGTQPGGDIHRDHSGNRISEAHMDAVTGRLNRPQGIDE
jgi:hypothetical protein